MYFLLPSLSDARRRTWVVRSDAICLHVGQMLAQSGAGSMRAIAVASSATSRVLIAAVRGLFAPAPRRSTLHARSPPRKAVGPDGQRRKIESPRISRRAVPAGNVSGSATASPALPITLQLAGQPSSAQPIVRALSVGAKATLAHSRG